MGFDGVLKTVVCADEFPVCRLIVRLADDCPEDIPDVVRIVLVTFPIE